MIIKLAEVLMLLCSLPLFTNGQQSVCTLLTTSLQTYQYYVQGSYQVSYSCGFLWLSTCYSTYYNSQLQYGSNIVYHQEVVCCSGYSSVGGDCLPTCPNCPESHSCLAPYFCACPENWSGEGCTEPPQNVALTATGPDTLQFSWSPPPQFQATLYVVIFQRATYDVDPSSDLVLDLDSLNTYTRYTCCVVANTASGASRIACATQTTLETAPGDAPRNMDLKTLNSTAIRIEWDPPLTPNGIIVLYTIYINGIPIWNIRSSYGTQSTSVGGFTPNQVVRVRLSASTSVGEGPRTASQTVTTHESVPGRVENLRVVPRSGNILRVTWSPPTYTNGVLIRNTIVVTNLADTTDTIRKTTSAYSRQLTIDRGIRPYIRYRVSVTASTKVGPGDPVRVTLYSQQGAPQSPPPNVNSTRKSPTNASVEWDGIRWEDLRGWLVDYEIGYGSVMMSVHQQCPANDSTYTETMSVDREYELTGLDPGLQYCVRLAGRTSAGVGPFSHTLIPWYTNSLFTITLEKENCSKWIAIQPAEIAQDIAKSVSNGIELTCNCTFPSDYITDRQLSCQNKNLTFRGRIISTLDRESTVLLEDFQTWLMSEPTVKAKSEQLKLARNRISKEETESAKNETGSATAGNGRIEDKSPSGSSIVGATVGGVVTVVVLLLAVVVFIVTAVVVRMKLRSKSSAKCTPVSILDDETTRSSPLRKHSFSSLFSNHGRDNTHPRKTPLGPTLTTPHNPPNTPPKPPAKPLRISAKTPPEPQKLPLKPLKMHPKPQTLLPKPLLKPRPLTPKPLLMPGTLALKPLKIPLKPPCNNPKPPVPPKVVPKNMRRLPPVPYELPVAQPENVYEDPEKMEVDGGTTSLRNAAYQGAGRRMRAEDIEKLYTKVKKRNK